QSRWYSEQAGSPFMPSDFQTPESSRLLSMAAMVPCVQQVPPCCCLMGVTAPTVRRSKLAGSDDGTATGGLGRGRCCGQAGPTHNRASTSAHPTSTDLLFMGVSSSQGASPRGRWPRTAGPTGPSPGTAPTGSGASAVLSFLGRQGSRGGEVP